MTEARDDDGAVTQTELWRGFETMTPAECRALLETTDVGRLALSSGALPVVLPVQYHVFGDRLLLRAPGHHELGDDLDDQIVGFEADRLVGGGVGWCVTVTGPMRSLPGVLDIGGPTHLWFVDGAVLELRTDVISGYRGPV